MSAARGALVALGVVVALAALAVQLFVDGLYGGLAAPHSIPHHIAGDWPFALAQRTGIDRIAPVRTTLVSGALVRNEPARALALLADMGDSPDLLDLRGRAILMTGDAAKALQLFAAAGDFVTASAAIDVLANTDPRAALAVVRDFERQLDARASEPEIGAEAAWREGVIAAFAAHQYPADAPALERESEDAFGRALARAPNEEKYLLNYAFAALRLGDVKTANGAYDRAAQVVPDSVDAFVGVAVARAVRGDCAASRSAIARAQTLATEQHLDADPKAAGFESPVLAAFARCAQ